MTEKHKRRGRRYRLLHGIEGPVTKGKTDGRYIKRVVRDGREMILHATKGWRNRRA